MARTAARPSLDAWLEALPAGIALTLLAALPSFFNLITEQVFEAEKSLLLRAAAMMAVPGTIAMWYRGDLRQLLRRPIVALFLALVVVIAISTVVAGGGTDAVFGAHVRRHGLVTWIALAVMFAAMVVAARSTKGRHLIVHAAMISAAWPSVYLLLQHAGLDEVVWAGPRLDPGSTFGNRVMLGGYLAMVIPLALSAAIRSHRAWFAPFTLYVVALIASGSRGALVALSAALAAWLAIMLWWRTPRRVAVGVIAGAALAVVVVAGVPALRPAALVKQLNPNVGSARVRVLIWQDTIAILRSAGPRIWLGYGPESFRTVFPSQYSAEIGYLEQIDAIPDRAHNETLDMLVSAGIVGALLQLAFFAAILWGARRVSDPWQQAGLIAAVVAHIVESQFGIATVGSRLALLAVAAVVSEAHVADDSAVAPRPAAYGWVLTAAVFGALSPWLSTLPSAFNSAPATGTEAQFIDYLRRVSVATLALYLGGFTIALGLARSLARSQFRFSAGWQLAALAVAAWAVVPLSIVPSRADAFSAAGASYRRDQRWAESAMAFGAAAREAPLAATYHADVGRASIDWAIRSEAARRAQLMQRAKDAFEQAVVLDGSDPIHARHLASYFRIEAAALQGPARETALVEADRIYTRETARAPGLTPLWVEWAWVDVDRQRPAEAQQKLDTALSLDSRRVDARLLRGELRLRDQDARGALQDFSAVLERDRRNIPAWRGRVAALIGLSRFDNARAAVIEALKYAPSDEVLLSQRTAVDGK